MGQHAEDEIHREMFGCYPWEEDFGYPSHNPKENNCPIHNLFLKHGITERKRVYVVFEKRVLDVGHGKNRKHFKRYLNAKRHFDLFKQFVELNAEVFKENGSKLKNLIIPSKKELDKWEK